MANFYEGFGVGGPPSFGIGGGILLVVVVVWTLYWKYRSLWHAAKSDHKRWFIALLVINTFGILEILYLYVFSKRANKQLPKHEEEKMPMEIPQASQ